MMKQIIRMSLAMTLTGSVAVAQDAMPRGTISYFTGDCPTGWTNTQLPTAVLGRSIVPTPSGGQPLQGVGDPLDAVDDLKHRHTIDSVEIDVGDEEVGLLNSCCNDNLGEGGDQEFQIAMPTGDSDGLPFLFLSVCAKIASPDPAPVPSGIMTFQPAACPNGTTQYEAASGRYILGSLTGLAPGTTFGGDPLIPGEIRAHQHKIDYVQVDIDASEIAASDCCTDGYAAAKHRHVTTYTFEDPLLGPATNSVNAPYFTANLCQVN